MSSAKEVEILRTLKFGGTVAGLAMVAIPNTF